MIWILVVVVVGLVVVLAQLLLAYQKRAVRLKVAMNPVRKQISSHKEKLTEIASNVSTMADDGLEQLQKDMSGFTRRSGHAANIVADLDGDAQAKAEEMAKEAGENGEDPHASENGEDDDEHQEHEAETDGILGGRKGASMRIEAEHVDPLEIVRSIRRDLEETYDYMESLRTDATIVKQTAQRAGPGKDGQGKGRDD